MSKLEEYLDNQLILIGISGYEHEYRFGAYCVGGPGKGVRDRLDKAGLKDWRFDFAWPHIKLAVEVEGGAWTNGRHTRGKGFSDDLIKYDAAMSRGWNIYRCDGDMIRSGRALKTIEILLDLNQFC